MRHIELSPESIVGSPEHFYSWVCMRDPFDYYEYRSICGCAIARYCGACGINYHFNTYEDCTFPTLEEMVRECSTTRFSTGSTTYGDLRRRLEKYYGL